MNKILLTIILFISSLSAKSAITDGEDSLYQSILCMDFDQPDIVWAQAVLETGHLKSKLCVNYNNLFGMKYPRKRQTLSYLRTKKGYAAYESRDSSLADYLLWQKYMIKHKMSVKAYLRYLDHVYCDVPGYSKQLRKLLRKNKGDLAAIKRMLEAYNLQLQTKTRKMKFEDFKLNPNWSEETKKTLEAFHKEIWTDNEYNRFDVGVKPGDTVVDLGASIGLFSQYALNEGARRVYAFETDPERCDYIKQNTRKSDVFVKQGYITGSPNLKTDLNLSGVLQLVDVFNVDFMKVDIEGAEYGFILNAEDKDIQRVRKWAIELHAWGMFANTADEYKLIMKVIEKLTLNGYDIKIQHIHENTCLYMLYAS